MVYQLILNCISKTKLSNVNQIAKIFTFNSVLCIRNSERFFVVSVLQMQMCSPSQQKHFCLDLYNANTKFKILVLSNACAKTSSNPQLCSCQATLLDAKKEKKRNSHTTGMLYTSLPLFYDHQTWHSILSTAKCTDLKTKEKTNSDFMTNENRDCSIQTLRETTKCET